MNGRDEDEPRFTVSVLVRCLKWMSASKVPFGPVRSLEKGTRLKGHSDKNIIILFCENFSDPTRVSWKGGLLRIG